jgi:hypothetical protein
MSGQRRFFSRRARRAAVLSLAAGLAVTGTAAPAAASPARSVGPSAITRIKHYKLEESYFTVNSGEQAEGSVSCPAGEVVLGGGAYVDSSSLQANINSSWPESATTWGAAVNDASNSGATFSVEVVCGDQPAHYSIVESAGVDNPAGSDTGAYAYCPKNVPILGGGTFASSLDTSVNMASSFPEQLLYPTKYLWQGDVNNGSSADDTVNAYAVCGKFVGYSYQTGQEGASPAGQQSDISWACPEGSMITGGGVEVIYNAITGGLLVNTSGTFPDNDLTSGWVNVVNNASSNAAEGVYPYVLCADT